MPLAGRVGAELGLGRFPRRSVFMPPAADVLRRAGRPACKRKDKDMEKRRGKCSVSVAPLGSDWICLRDSTYS